MIKKVYITLFFLTTVLQTTGFSQTYKDIIKGNERYNNWKKERIKLPNLDSVIFMQKICFKSDTFLDRVSFRHAKFDSIADFDYAEFDSLADFSRAIFNSKADFADADFNSKADFDHAKFNSIAYFDYTEFYSLADFSRAVFNSKADFEETEFDSLADFGDVRFDSLANFGGAEFKSKAYFRYVKFDSTADFVFADFNSTADFVFAEFNSTADFFLAEFNSKVYFTYAQFESKADFFNVKFKSKADFSYATFNSIANFDFVRFNSSANFNNVTFNKNVIFDDATLPDTLFFNSVQINSDYIDFSETVLRDSRKKCKIILNSSGKNKILLPYDKFEIVFDKSVVNNIDKQKSIYRKILKVLKEAGYDDSYASFDIDFQLLNFKSKGILSNCLGKFIRFWWGFGHEKWRVFIHTLVLLLIFSIINTIWFDQFTNKVYDFSGNYKLNLFYLKRRKLQRFNLSLFYTAMIFFSLKFTLEKLKYKELISGNFKDRFWLTYFFIIFTSGLICLGFIANIILG